MAGVVRLAVATFESDGESPAPSDPGILKIADRGAVVLEAEILVIDFPLELQSSPNCELPLQHMKRPRTELDDAIFARLGAILVACAYPRLVDFDFSLGDVTVGHA